MTAPTHHITNYKVLRDEDADALGRKVEAAIHDGWQPFGALTISPRSEGFRSIYAQAMVKYADRFYGGRPEPSTAKSPIWQRPNRPHGAGASLPAPRFGR